MRVFRLGAEPRDDLSDTTTVEERLDILRELTGRGSDGLEVVGRQSLFDMGDRGLFRGANYTGWDVSHDDQSFMMVQLGAGDGRDRPNEFILVQNWLEEVKARLRK